LLNAIDDLKINKSLQRNSRGYISHVYLTTGTSKPTLVYIQMYPGKVVALLKEQAAFIKARIALMWMVCLITITNTSFGRFYQVMPLLMNK